MSEFNNIKNTANDLYEEGKNKAESKANELYEEGKKKVNQIEDNICDYSNEVVKLVKEQPLSSLLIAGSIGFLLSRMLKK